MHNKGSKKGKWFFFINSCILKCFKILEKSKKLCKIRKNIKINLLTQINYFLNFLYHLIHLLFTVGFIQLNNLRVNFF